MHWDALARTPARALLVGLVLAALLASPAAATAPARSVSSPVKRTTTWQEFQTFFLRATGMGLVRLSGDSRSDFLNPRDAKTAGPLFDAFVKRFGYTRFFVYRRGHNPADCWKGWSSKPGSGNFDSLHWRDQGSALAGGIWQFATVYGSVCVTTYVTGSAPSLPATWFRVHAVMSKLQ